MRQRQAGNGITTRSALSDGSLCTVFTDPDFGPAVPAYYYLRAVEQACGRCSAFDCQRLTAAEQPSAGQDPSVLETLQEMAWTSLIWYRP